MIDIKTYGITIYEAEEKEKDKKSIKYSVYPKKIKEKLNYYYCENSKKTIEDLKEFIYEISDYSICPCKLKLCKAEYRNDLGKMDITAVSDFKDETLLSQANINKNFYLIELKNKDCNCKYYNKKDYFYKSKIKIINTFENEINIKNKEINEISEKLKKINERLLNQSNDNLKFKINELNEKILLKNEEISRLENIIENLKKENLKYKNDLSNSNKRKENQIEELILKEKNLKKNMDKLKIQLDEKAEIIKTLETEKFELKKNYDNVVSEKQILEKNYLNKGEIEKNFNQKLNDLESKNEGLKQENKELNIKISELTLAINRDIGTIKQFNDLGLLKNITINNNCIQIDPKNNQIIGNNNQGNEDIEKNLDDFYDIIVNIKSVKDIAKGWEIKMTQRGEENFERYKKEELLKIGVIGNSNKGKSFLLSRLSKITLPSGTSIKTEGLSVKYPELKEFQNRKIVLLDSAGLETPVLKGNDENMINKNINNKEEDNDNDEKVENKNEGEEENENK